MSLRPTEETRVLVTLPYPPLLNHMYIKTRRGIRLSDAAISFRQMAQIALRWVDHKFTGELAVTLHVYRPRKVGDIDATQKAVFDALNGVLWHDDKQIVEMHVYRHDDKLCPRVELEVTAL